MPALEQRNPTSNFSSVLKLLSFALFNFQLFNILNYFGVKLLTALSICLLILKRGLALQCLVVAIRGLSTVKFVELFKHWFTLLRGNHINRFHNGACDSDACFHSKRESFYHFRIMINKSTDCFGHTY